MEGLFDLLNELERAAQKPAKQRLTKTSGIVEQLSSISSREGLSDSAFERLIDLITLPNELDQTTKINLIRNLFPTSKISNTIVFKIVSCIGHGQSKASYSIQVGLLKWLIMIYDFVENQKVYSQVYNILFNLLDTIAIRPQICHLLSIITRRKHVRPFRIQLLMEMIRQTGNEPALTRLLHVFKLYFPDIVTGQVTSGRAGVFTHPSSEWKDKFHEIQKKNSLKTHGSLVTQEKGSRVFRLKLENSNDLPKSIIPMIQTSNAQESSITLEEIENVQDLVNYLEIIEAPDQLVAVLENPMLQKFLQLRPLECHLQRVDNWLFAYFNDELEKSSNTSEIFDVLRLVLDYTRFIKVLPPACTVFLKSMIPSWDGFQGRDIILDLLAYTPLDSFAGSLFSPLEEILLDNRSIDSKLALIKLYTALLHHWTVCLLVNPEHTSNADTSVSTLVEHANNLALTTIQISSTVSTVSTVLAFYEATAALTHQASIRSPLSVIFSPPPEAVYTLCFTSSLSILSRICTVLAIYKRALEVPISPKKADIRNFQGSQISTKQSVSNFNGYLIDFCNLLWRSRAFNTEDTNAMGCHLSLPVIQSLDKYVTDMDNILSLSELFGLSLSPVTCLLAFSYFREEENKVEGLEKRHDGPVTRTSLKRLQKDNGLEMSWKVYKLGVLRYLEIKGAPGISELIHSTLKQLLLLKDN